MHDPHQFTKSRVLFQTPLSISGNKKKQTSSCTKLGSELVRWKSQSENGSKGVWIFCLRASALLPEPYCGAGEPPFGHCSKCKINISAHSDSSCPLSRALDEHLWICWSCQQLLQGCLWFNTIYRVCLTSQGWQGGVISVCGGLWACDVSVLSLRTPTNWVPAASCPIAMRMKGKWTSVALSFRFLFPEPKTDYMERLHLNYKLLCDRHRWVWKGEQHTEKTNKLLPYDFSKTDA